MPDVIGFFLDPANWEGTTGIPNRLVEHLFISGSGILAATLIALPLGLFIGHTGRGSGLAINLANIGRAVPSYAMMVIPLPLTLSLAPVLGYSPTLGLNFLPIFIAMTLLAIPPILVNTFAGIRAVDRDLVEAGRGMGLTERQILRQDRAPARLAGHHRRLPDGNAPGHRHRDDRRHPVRRRARALHLRRDRPGPGRSVGHLWRRDPRVRTGDRGGLRPGPNTAGHHAARCPAGRGPSRGRIALVRSLRIGVLRATWGTDRKTARW